MRFLLAALLLFCLAPEASAQARDSTGTLAGIVTGAETGETLPGANVVVKGTDFGASTNLDGEFRIIGIPIGEYTVEVSFAGADRRSVEAVQIAAFETTELAVELVFSPDMSWCYHYYEPPIISLDPYAVRVISGYDIERMPLRR